MAERLSNRRRKEINKLGRKKYRKRLGQMVVEGVRSVEAAVEAGAPLVDVVVSSTVRGDEGVEDVLTNADVPVYEVSEGEMKKLSDVKTPQGLLAVVRTELLAEEELPAQQTIVALDGVQDPGNVGTALRTAAWFGAEAVVGGTGTAGFFNPKVVRASMGGLWDLHLAQADDLAVLLARLRERGFGVYGADLEGTSVRGWQPQRPSVLVLGSEAHGLSPSVKEQLTQRLVIQGAAGRYGTESLNVAVAAGILMYQWLG